MTTSGSYQRNISEIARFLTTHEDGGFLFAVVKHQGIIPEINDTLRRLGKNSDKKIHTFRAKSRSDRTYTAQVTHASAKADALIFNNLDEFIVSKPKENLLTKLNFSRETLYALRTPMLFWVHENNLQTIHNHFADVYSQRALANIYFDDIPETDAGDELDQYFGEEYLDTKEYERIKLRINLLTHQLEDAEKTNYPPLRTANDIVISLIDAYVNIRVYEPIIELLEKYQPQFKNTFNNLLIQGKVYRRLYEYDKALLIYNEAIDNYDSVIAYCAKANLLGLKGDYTAAKDIYEKVVERFPNNVIAKNGLAEILKQQGDYTAAKNIYEPILEQFPRNLVARNGLAEVLKEQGDYTAARDIYEQTVKRFPNNVFAIKGLAEVLKQQGEYKLLQRVYKETVKRFPNDLTARNGLAKLYKKYGNYESAKDIYKQTLGIFPNNLTARIGLAEIHKKQKNYDIAESDYKQILELFPNNKFVRNGLADVHKKQGNYELSKKMYQQTLELFPNDIVTKSSLGFVLLKLNEYNKALKLFEEVLSINPEDKYANKGKDRVLQVM